MNIFQFLRNLAYRVLHVGDYLKSLRYLKKRSNLAHKIAPYTWIDDKYWLEFYYFRIFGKRLNLRNPQTFNEKIQWVKLFDRNPIYTKLADKYQVREYVSKRIGPEFLIPLLGTYDIAEDIPWDSLPSKFVIKPNHGAGWVFIKDSQTEIRKDELTRQINGWLKVNFYQIYREWHYKNIKPKIIIEQKIETKSNTGLIEYKFFCFGGDPKLIQINLDRFTNLSLQFYDIEWNLLPISLEHYSSSTKLFLKPTNLQEMLNIARKLSSGLRFCRVDLYSEQGKILFGELTLTPNAGVKRFVPEEIDLMLGKMINIKTKIKLC